MTFKNILLAGTALGAAAILAGPAFAGSSYENDAVKAQIEALQQQIDDMKIQYGNDLKDIKEKQDAVQVGLKDGKPTFKTGDGLFTFAIRGRAHFDMGGGQTNGFNNAIAKDYHSGANFRRAEIGVEGTFMKDWAYTIGIQYGGSGTDNGAQLIKEAYLSYEGIQNVKIQAGAIGIPLTMEYATSSNDITFIERSAAANMMIGLGSDDGRNAVGVRAHTDNLFGMVYYTKAKTAAANPTTTDESDQWNARLAYAFSPVEKSNVHIGASATYAPFVPGGSITMSDRPGLRVEDIKYISATVNNVDTSLFYGPELAASWGPVKLQGEYYVYDFNRKTGSADASLNAYYVQASWVLTGEAYKYSIDSAAYKGVKPASPFTLGGGIGAIELAASYGVADLVDRGAGVNGGKEERFTGGVNWYVNNNVRFMLNYIHADEKDNTLAANNGKVDLYALRTQFAF